MSKLEKCWVLYDVGNSAFTLLVSTIIPIYFKNMASANGVSDSDSTAYLSYAISLSTLIVALIGPVLGTVADNKNHKKPLFTFFMMLGVLGCAGLALPKSVILFLAVFVIARVGFREALFSMTPCWWMSRRMSAWTKCPRTATRGATSEAAFRFC